MPYVFYSTLIVLLDQWFKHWISARLAVSGSVVLIPGVMGLTLVHNRGASWGILQGRTALLLAVTFLACAGILTVLLLGKPKSRLGRASLCLILGGAVGNAVDRLLLGYVVDMFETLFVDFPVFNVADSFITVGAALLIIDVCLEERRERKANAVLQAKTAETETENGDVGTDRGA